MVERKYNQYIINGKHYVSDMNQKLHSDSFHDILKDDEQYIVFGSTLYTPKYSKVNYNVRYLTFKNKNNDMDYGLVFGASDDDTVKEDIKPFFMNIQTESMKDILGLSSETVSGRYTVNDKQGVYGKISLKDGEINLKDKLNSDLKSKFLNAMSVLNRQLIELGFSRQAVNEYMLNQLLIKLLKYLNQNDSDVFNTGIELLDPDEADSFALVNTQDLVNGLQPKCPGELSVFGYYNDDSNNEYYLNRIEDSFNQFILENRKLAKDSNMELGRQYGLQISSQFSLVGLFDNIRVFGNHITTGVYVQMISQDDIHLTVVYPYLLSTDNKIRVYSTIDNDYSLAPYTMFDNDGDDSDIIERLNMSTKSVFPTRLNSYTINTLNLIDQVDQIDLSGSGTIEFDYIGHVLQYSEKLYEYLSSDKFRNSYGDGLNNMNESSDLQYEMLNEAATQNKALRTKIENMILGVMDSIDKSKYNGDKFRTMFAHMDDQKFFRYIKKVVGNNDDEARKNSFMMEFLAGHNNPKLDDVLDGLDFLKVPKDQYVYYNHDGSDNVRSRYRVPVGYATVRRLQHTRKHKNTYSYDINGRNPYTGALSESIGSLSGPEASALEAIGAEAILKEFMGARGDSMDSKNTMYNEINENGYLRLTDMPDNDLSKKSSLSSAAFDLISAGINNDLLGKTDEDKVDFNNTFDKK